MNTVFSIRRLWAIIIKEFIQMLRDRLTLAMIIAIPALQLILFGYAINSNPKNLPSMVVSNDHSSFTRTYLEGIKNTNYFRFINTNATEDQAKKAMEIGNTQFIINVPTNFSKDLIRGEHPNLLLTVDGSESMAAANAITAANALTNQVFTQNLLGALSYLQESVPPFNLIIHVKYNPELTTQYNIVPGLLGVVLTMIMVMITAQSITRERERGTMEFLLATPARPIEVMLGKVIPYIIVGYIEVLLILFTSSFLFHVPIVGSILLLCLSAFPFILASLAVGITFSTIADNQLQATQMSFFFFLPSILLSGFMFPFFGMPTWAQWVGRMLPLTYFLRIVRGIMLKGNTFITTWPNIWPILIFMVIALTIGVLRYRQTLD